MNQRAAERVPAAAALRALLMPRSVAVLGVSEDRTKHNRIVFDNLRRAGFAGPVYPISRRLRAIDGVVCYPSPAALPEPVDLVFLAIPAAATPAALTECAEAGIKVAIIGSAGYAESGPEGAARQEDLRALGERHGIRIVGPNCNGVYNTAIGLSVGFNTAHARRLRRGDVAILSHSGALFDAMVGRLEALGAGLSIFVSAGNEVDLDLLDYLDFALDDAATRVVALLLDGLADGDRFRRLAERAGRLGKALVALKVGVSEEGEAAAVAHSSRMVASAGAYRSLFEASGVPLVGSLEGLMTAASLLSFYGQIEGGLAAFSTSGVGAALIADLAAARGIPLTRFSAATATALAPHRRFSRVGNPADLGAFGGASAAFDVPAIIAADPDAAVLVALMHSVNEWQLGYAEALVEAQRATGKPLIVVAPGGLSEVERRLYADARVFDDTATTLDGVEAMLASPRPYPPIADSGIPVDADPAVLRLDRVLTEPESLDLLARFGIPVVPTRVCGSREAAVAAAESLGWPVVLKAVVEGVAHKSDLGLVKLGLADAAALHRAYDELGAPAQAIVQPMMPGRLEAIVGLTRLPDLGLMLVAGFGGVYAEAFGAPLTWPVPTMRDDILKKLAADPLGRVLTSSRWLDAGAREAVVQVLLGLQRMALWAGERLEAVDINPLILGPAGAVAVDALVLRRVSPRAVP